MVTNFRFTDRGERFRVCRVLLGRADLRPLWTPEGPSDTAKDLLAQNGGTLCGRRRAFFLLAWIVWKFPLDPTRLRASELFLSLDSDDLRLLGFLLGTHGGALQEWLGRNEHG